MARVQPVVLVGGRSTRFGRDKLREPWGERAQMLVQRPIRALRAVFGPRVRVVGACHPDVALQSDGTIPDVHPGIGPIGGIVSALMAWGGPIFVLAGDMPGFTPADVLLILGEAEAQGGVLAVLAATDRAHPCAGVYAPGSLPLLVSRIERGDSRLVGAIPEEMVRRVPVSEAAAANVNEPP